jgi:hypothetical protein
MKKLIEALQFILQFMKNPDEYAPCQCADDVLCIWGVDFSKMTADDVKKIANFGFYPGFGEDDFIKECFGDKYYDWEYITDEIWDKMKYTLSDCLCSYRYGSC